MSQGSPVKEGEDAWPHILRVLEYLYIVSWGLSWLAAFSAMENARKKFEGIHESNFTELDVLTPLFISCQKACRWPQKVFEVIEAARVHKTKHPRFRKRLAYLCSTTIKLILWSLAAFYTGSYYYILLAFYGIMLIATWRVVSMTTKDEDWPPLRKAMLQEVKRTEDKLMELTRLACPPLRY